MVNMLINIWSKIDQNASNIALPAKKNAKIWKKKPPAASPPSSVSPMLVKIIKCSSKIIKMLSNVGQNSIKMHQK